MRSNKEYTEGGIFPNYQTEIQCLEDREEKLRYMRDCDSSFSFSVIHRDNFSTLFNKIHKYAVFLAFAYDKARIGYAAIYANDKSTETAYITLICIAVPYQGKRFGTLLMDECFRVSAKAGMKRIRLEVLEQNHQAIRFYEVCGFRNEGRATEKSRYMIREI